MAEYRAILLGLELARELGASEVEVVNDSELVARQIGGEYKVKNKGLMPLFTETMAALREFDRWSVRDVRREQNERADQLVNEELDRQAGGDAPEEDDDRPKPRSRSSYAAGRQAVAEREMAFLETLLAPEFTLTTGRPAAPVRTREQYLAITRDEYEVESWQFDEIVVQHYGRFAVARSRYTQTGRMGGESARRHVPHDRRIREAVRSLASGHAPHYAARSRTRFRSRHNLDECPGAQFANLVHSDPHWLTRERQRQ